MKNEKQHHLFSWEKTNNFFETKTKSEKYIHFLTLFRSGKNQNRQKEAIKFIAIKYISNRIQIELASRIIKRFFLFSFFSFRFKFQKRIQFSSFFCFDSFSNVEYIPNDHHDDRDGTEKKQSYIIIISFSVHFYINPFHLQRQKKHNQIKIKDVK